MKIECSSCGSTNYVRNVDEMSTCSYCGAELHELDLDTCLWKWAVYAIIHGGINDGMIGDTGNRVEAGYHEREKALEIATSAYPQFDGIQVFTTDE